MRKLGWLLAFLALLTAAARPAAAQGTGNIQGTVSDADARTPLAGVRVSVDGTTLGAVTGADGRFEIRNVPAGTRTLRAARLGYATAQRQVSVTAGGTATAVFSLDPAGVVMDELVVTALGITREKREISTSVQEVSGEALAQGGEPNLVTALSGKVSGVTITNSNTPGGSSRIVIRGANSLTANNQPLFVLDGVPVSNSAPEYVAGTCSGCTGFNAIDYGNIIQDLNPADIESITVLKGPNAAALYGSRAANGAIIITTRSGRGGETRVTGSSLVTFETPLRLPRYQNLYGQGQNGQYEYVDGRGQGTFDDTDESWGPRLDSGLMIRQFFSNGQPAPWVSHPDNVRSFFDTGRTVNTSAAFASGGDGMNVRLSVANLAQEGMYPGFEMDRTTAGLNGSARLGSRLNAGASVQYINTDAKNRPAQGYGEDNVMWQFIWFGRQVDTNLLRQRMRNEDGSQFNWNNQWNNNPYWTALVNGNADTRDRIIGSATLRYDFAPWLSGMVRSGTDWYEENRTRTYQAGTIGQSGTGAFNETTIFEQETNSDFLLTATLPARGDFDLSANFGGNRRDSRGRLKGSSVDSLIVPGLFNMNNRAVEPVLSDRRSARRVNSLYGSAQVGWRETWFLEATGRNDWSSTLPESNRSYFYPSVSTNVIFTQLADVPFLSYGKVRASWSEVGNDTDPYNLVDPYLTDEFFNDNPRLTSSNLLRNPLLKPERTRSWEVGTELRGSGDRLGLELTYYNKVTRNQIVPVQVTPLTGVTERMLNAGQISNRGVEVLLQATPLRLSNGLEWSLTANYTRNRSNVDALAEGLENLVLGTFYNTSVQARPGQPYGVIYGRKYVRDSQGRIVVGSTGLPLTTGPIERLGKYDPDWTGGISSRIAYGGVDLNVLVDGRFGGNIFSMTNMHGRRSGVLYESLRGRETAHAIADGGGFIVPGVRVVNGDTVENTIRVTAQQYHKSISQTSSGITEEWLYDATFVKLREVRLGYTLPAGFTRRMRVNGVSLALIGRNLALWADAPNIDPETAFNASNVQGFEYGQLPSARSVGFNISVTP
ncbi:MAG TPA: SusC/RagA family TonB-linked outer membrane protein [Longimicrobium sp.]|nr:SusC/RagA family TonB-linked outer membrane protein [Longimicrobium sp.]